MTSNSHHSEVSSIALITLLATCLWIATPVAEAASGESDMLAPDDETTLEIPTVGSPDSGKKSGPDEFGPRDEYEQASKDVSVSSPAQYINDGSSFDFETRATRLIGITVDDEMIQREGRWVEGIIIVSVIKNSPAALSGLKGERTVLQHVLETGVVACSVFFPPGFMVVPFIEEHDIGKSYDLIIGVDGERVRDVMDLDDSLQKVEPGEIVYLSIIRGRHRVQIPVPLPQERVQQH